MSTGTGLHLRRAQPRDTMHILRRTFRRNRRQGMILDARHTMPHRSRNSAKPGSSMSKSRMRAGSSVKGSNSVSGNAGSTIAANAISRPRSCKVAMASKATFPP